MTDAQDTTRQYDSVQSAIKQLFIGCAPEREAELHCLWLLLDPKFQLVGDLHEGEQFVLDAGAYRYVRFNHRAVRAIWLGAFVAWEGYRAVAESSELGDVDFGRLAQLIEAFGRILASDQPDVEPLPEGIPEPGTYPDLVHDSQRRAAAELATIAAGWAMLHEVRHIRHQQEGTSADPDGPPESFHEEELSCDAFATSFLLERIPEYATSVAADPARVQRKREIAIYFALFTLTLLAHGQWGPSQTHPAVQDRINAVAALMGPERDEVAEAIARVAFAALHTLWPSAPGML